MTGATLASNEDAPSPNSHLPTSSNSPNVSLPYLHSPAPTSSPARFVPPTPTSTPTRASSDPAHPSAPSAPPHHHPHPPQLNYQYQTHLNQPHPHRSQPLQTHHHVGAIRHPTNPTKRTSRGRTRASVVSRVANPKPIPPSSRIFAHASTLPRRDARAKKHTTPIRYTSHTTRRPRTRDATTLTRGCTHRIFSRASHRP